MRQGFAGLLADPPIAALTAIVATVETALWLPARWTPIPANDPVAGRIYVVKAGGIMSFAATGTLIITPRYGLSVAAGITMGASPVALTTPGATTNVPWTLEFTCVVQSIGDPGVTSKVIGEGHFHTGIPAAGSLPATQTFGGTVATVDTSIASGICIGWTLSVAGSVTPHYAYCQSVN